MATLSVAVMAHPKREPMVDELLGWLDRPATVVWDRINDRHDTGARAMEAFDPDCTHHLVVQDDVVPCQDLIAGAEQALDSVPDNTPASLYIGKVRPFRREVERAVHRAGDQASWIVMQGIYWGPGIIVPTHMIEALLAWFRSPAGGKVENYDRRISTWFRHHGGNPGCWYTWPSLLDHRGAQSLVRDSDAERNCHRFLGADVSAIGVDWGGEVVAMRGTENMDRTRQLAAKRALERR